MFAPRSPVGDLDAGDFRQKALQEFEAGQPRFHRFVGGVERVGGLDVCPRRTPFPLAHLKPRQPHQGAGRLLLREALGKRGGRRLPKPVVFLAPGDLVQCRDVAGFSLEEGVPERQRLGAVAAKKGDVAAQRVRRGRVDGERFFPRHESRLARVHFLGSELRARHRLPDVRAVRGELQDAPAQFGDGIVIFVLLRDGKLAAKGVEAFWRLSESGALGKEERRKPGGGWREQRSASFHRRGRAEIRVPIIKTVSSKGSEISRTRHKMGAPSHCT